jgi:hypothetical protein
MPLKTPRIYHDGRVATRWRAWAMSTPPLIYIQPPMRLCAAFLGTAAAPAAKLKSKERWMTLVR